MWVRGITLARNGTRLVSGGSQNMLIVWDFDKQKVLHRLDNGPNEMRHVLMMKDEIHIICVSLNKSVSIWNIETAELTCRWDGHERNFGGVFDLALTQDEQTLYIAHDEGLSVIDHVCQTVQQPETEQSVRPVYNHDS